MLKDSRKIGTRLVDKFKMSRNLQLSSFPDNRLRINNTKSNNKNMKTKLTITQLILLTHRPMIKRSQMNSRKITVSSTWTNIIRKHVRTKRLLIKLWVMTAKYNVYINQAKKRSFSQTVCEERPTQMVI